MVSTQLSLYQSFIELFVIASYFAMFSMAALRTGN